MKIHLSDQFPSGMQEHTNPSLDYCTLQLTSDHHKGTVPGAEGMQSQFYHWRSKLWVGIIGSFSRVAVIMTLLNEVWDCISFPSFFFNGFG